MLLTPPPPRIPAPTPEAFQRDWVEARRPVILQGAIDHWPARRLWSAGHFRARHGDEITSVAITDRGQLARDPGVGIRYVSMDVASAIDAVFGPAAPLHYLIATLETELPMIADEVEIPPYCARRPRLRSRLWISAADTVSPLHRDFPDNLFAQVVGRKQFIVLPPTEDRRVYEHPFRSKLPRVSAVDPEQPDYDRFPRFRSARGTSFVLEPGDLLFLPGGHWHHVRSLDASYSINWWWAEGLTRLLVTAADVYKKVRAVRL